MKRKITEKQLANLKKHAIKKGEVRNPLGLNNPDLTKIRRLTGFELAEVGSLMLRKDRGALKKIIKAPDGHETVLRRMYAQQALDAMEGDYRARSELLDRTAGKVADKVQVFSPEDDTQKADQLTDAQKDEIIKRNIEKLGISEGE